jgi:hypothetical protein
MSSSESLAAMILANLMSVKTDSDLPTPKAVTAAAAAAPPALPQTIAEDDDEEDEDHYCCSYDAYGPDDYHDYEKPFSSSGIISHKERLSANFALFGLDVERVIAMMRDTSMVIGGGFMVNHILAMNGLDKPLCPNSDIDFYVYGGISPMFHGSSFDRTASNKHNSERIQATAFRTMVTRRFYDLVNPAGYSYGFGEENEYNCERTEAGDRVFTTGSDIRMQVLTYKAQINGQNKKLNLVFTDTNMYDFITKVDISLTAGFFCANSAYQTFDYHHAAPQDLLELKLKWMQLDSTHTPRQKARMAKYRTRYNLMETLNMTTAEFIRDYDTLPDEQIHIELKGTEDNIYSKPVVRRVLGLPTVKFTVAILLSSLLGNTTIYSNFPTAADRAHYAQQKAREAARVPVPALLPPRNPSLVVHDDEE